MPWFGLGLGTAGTLATGFDNGFGGTGTITSAATNSANYVVWQTTSTATAGTCASSGYYEPQVITHRRYLDYGAQRERQAETVRAHAKAAKARAQTLLMSHLTQEQQQTLKKNGWFVVEGGKSKQRYRIRSEDHLVANIDVMEGKRVKHRLCAHCDLKAVPLGDQLLAQKTMLELAEDDFLRVANRHAA